MSWSVQDESTSSNLTILFFLKLKYGCLPTSRFITKRNFIKQNVTRFRMHQALKLQNGEIWMLYFADLVRCFIVHCGSMIFMSNKGIDGVHTWHISTDNIWVKVAMVSSFADELMIQTPRPD